MRKVELEPLVDRYYEGSASKPEDTADPPTNPRVAAVILIGLFGAFVWTMSFLYEASQARPARSSSARPVHELAEPR